MKFSPGEGESVSVGGS